MKVYVILSQDRHADAEVEVHLDRQSAIEAARANIDSFEGEHNRLNSAMVSAGWIYHGTYGEEDTVTVMEVDTV